MNKDIVPELLEKIQSEFKSKSQKSKVLKQKILALKAGKATHLDSNEFAIEVGKILADVFKDEISSDILPDGKMYYNIAKRLIEPNMKNNFDIVSDYSREVQEVLNKESNISLKAIKPELNQDRIDGIVNKISEYDDFKEGKWLLEEPIKNFTQSIVDDTIKTNADFQYKSGLTPKIVRKEVGTCCDWCKEVVGVYEYPDVPKDVYRRHQRCRCTVDYLPGNGKKQDVWSKKWTELEKNDKIKIRIETSKESNKPKMSNVAYTKAIEMGYKPLSQEKVVNILRKDSNLWIKKLSNYEKNAITKYTFNGVDEDKGKLFRKINEYVEGIYNPKDVKEEDMIIRMYNNIYSALLKNSTNDDIILYRRDINHKGLDGITKKFLSTSVTQKGVFKSKPNVAIIAPKNTSGAYIELLSNLPNQREFLLNSGSHLKQVYSDDEFSLYEVISDD